MLYLKLFLKEEELRAEIVRILPTWGYFDHLCCRGKQNSNYIRPIVTYSAWMWILKIVER